MINVKSVTGVDDLVHESILAPTPVAPSMSPVDSIYLSIYQGGGTAVGSVQTKAAELSEM